MQPPHRVSRVCDEIPESATTHGGTGITYGGHWRRREDGEL